jgi:hypothetical protein
LTSLSGRYDGFGDGDLVGNFGGPGLFISDTAGGGNNMGLYTNAVPEPTTVLICRLMPHVRWIIVGSPCVG